MELRGKVAIVTGGASGIGRALAERLVAEGCAGVAVADLRGAADVPGTLGVTCDVAVEADVQALIERTEAAFGPVDAFFANAGIGAGSDEQTPDEVWQRAYAVNVHAHVIAARLLVPGWLERGTGCFVATASAAGLLTQIGVAPYAVTKHAAVAFAEWLAITYGDRGIQVACLCPMGVDTPLIDAAAGAALRAVLAGGEVLSPAAVADAVVRGLAGERFLILPHPEVLEHMRRRADDHERWLAGMRRLRRTAEA